MKLWEELGRVIGAHGTCPPARVAHHLTVLSQSDYLPMVMELLYEHITADAATSGEEWCGFVSYDRSVDVDQIMLPKLLDLLGRFSAEGKLEDLLGAATQVTHLLTRELLRAGKLPVMYPVGHIPSTPVSDNPYPVVGAFAEFQHG